MTGKKWPVSGSPIALGKPWKILAGLFPCSEMSLLEKMTRPSSPARTGKTHGASRGGPSSSKAPGDETGTQVGQAGGGSPRIC